MKVPPGGSATINGVLYQLLWSVLRAAKANVLEAATSEGELRKTTLILEPIGGGGDLVVGSPTGKVVEQLKARPDGGTWSLKEVIEDVIPDLYLGYDPAVSEYRFITEGRIGAWNDVYAFFQTLLVDLLPLSGPPPQLDSATPFKFRRSKTTKKAKKDGEPFWDDKPYTQQTLFEKILNEVRKRSAVSSEPEETARRKLWSVLGRFRFIGGQMMADIQSQIDMHLLGVVDHQEDIPQVRDMLAASLGRKATTGNAVIEPTALFQEHGLNAIPLNNWHLFRSRVDRFTDNFLLRHGYVPEFDVRYGVALQSVSDWPALRPILLIAGGSGQGKSWSAYASALAARSPKYCTLIIDATGDAQLTLRRVSNALWNDIGNHDAELALQQIARRVKRIFDTFPIGGNPGAWLTLVIDGVDSVDEGLALAQEPWELWGVRLVLAANAQVADRVRLEFPVRTVFRPIEDFRPSELHDYLERTIGESWTEIPEYVREPLKRPLLASMFSRLAVMSSYRPRNEYEIYQALWDDLSTAYPFDALALTRLCGGLLKGDPYPMSLQQLQVASIDQACQLRLESRGWLRTVVASPLPQFDVPHDRLLNWLVAVVLVDLIKSGGETPESVGSRLATYMQGGGVSGHRMGFVAMDAVWLMIRPPVMESKLGAVLAHISAGASRPEILYHSLLPTIGPDIIGVLTAQLRCELNNSRMRRLIAESIARIGGVPATAVAKSLLEESDPFLQRAAMVILETCPAPDMLDRLWQIHRAVKLDASPYLLEHETKYDVLGESFKALRRSSAANPGWLRGKIAERPRNDPMVETIANLIAAIGGDVGRAIWLESKAELISKIAADSQRCIANCIDAYADDAEMPWIVDRLGSSDDLVCSKALSVLARIDPRVAVEHLDKLPQRLLASTREWYCDRLFAGAEPEMRARILELMQRSQEGHFIAQVYVGREYLVDPSTARALLIDLEECLADSLDEGVTRGSEPAIHARLTLLASLGTVEQLAVFAEMRGTQLPKMLATLLISIGPRTSLSQDSALRDPGVTVLARIGGEQFTYVMNYLLASDSRYGRFDAIQKCARRLDSTSIQLLEGIVDGNESWDGIPVEQSQAAEILVESDRWDKVAAYIVRMGLKASRSVTHLHGHSPRPPKHLVEASRTRVLTDVILAAPGDVLMLGIGNDPSDASVLLAVLDKSDSKSDLARACLVALALLRDESHDAVALIARCMSEHPDAACAALMANGSDAARRHMWEHCRLNFSVDLFVSAANGLSLHDGFVSEAVDLLVARRLASNALEFGCELGFIVHELQEGAVANALVDSVQLREYVTDCAYGDEGTFWVDGAKAAVIRVMSRFDREGAYIAARSALRKSDSHDRDRYPLIMMELDAVAAFPDLLSQLAHETDVKVSGVIGRAMISDDVDDKLAGALQSPEPKVVLAACIAAGWASRSDAVADLLRSLLKSPDSSIANEAARALCRLRQATDGKLLAEAICAEDSSDERWRLLDGLLQIADEGDGHSRWPSRAPPLGEALNWLQLKHVAKRLRESRGR